MWDDLHNDVEAVGPKVKFVGTNRFHHPWRPTAWEIHPILKLEMVE